MPHQIQQQAVHLLLVASPVLILSSAAADAVCSRLQARPALSTEWWWCVWGGGGRWGACHSCSLQPLARTAWPPALHRAAPTAGGASWCWRSCGRHQTQGAAADRVASLRAVYTVGVACFEVGVVCFAAVCPAVRRWHSMARHSSGVVVAFESWSSKAGSYQVAATASPVLNCCRTSLTHPQTCHTRLKKPCSSFFCPTLRVAI